MSFFKPKFVLLALLSALLPALSSSGCTGGAFTSSDASGGKTSSGGSTSLAGISYSGSSSSAGAGTVNCSGPEDCDDKDICTTDRCNADGTCGVSPKCGGSDKCCSGDCAQCCLDTDCDDGLSCTDNTCFAGQCMFLPKDAKCTPSEYCSTKDGCKERQSCTGLPSESPSVCDDKVSCTVDSCVKNFCEHDFCDPNSDAKLCCEGGGCAACCNDAQCDSDDDPCTVGSCQNGKCSVVSRCAEGESCCPSADRTTASCGKCCSAEDCDDKIGCTLDQCGGGQCSNTPQQCSDVDCSDTPLACKVGYVCDLEAKGCVKAQGCTVADNCVAEGCQTNPTCDSDTGTCHFDPCQAGTKCCDDLHCAACCGDQECNDEIPCTDDSCSSSGCSHVPNNGTCPKGYTCNAEKGCLAVCNGDADCQRRVITLALPIIGSCQVSRCVKGQCQDETLVCNGLQTCCAATGTCTPPLKCISTQ